MAAVEKIRTWPTIEEVESVISTLDDAENWLDEFLLRCYSLTDPDDQLEPVPGGPVPTRENIAVLSIACVRFRDALEGMTGDLARLEKLREAAVYLRRDEA
jgi:hypothetical protein